MYFCGRKDASFVGELVPSAEKMLGWTVGNEAVGHRRVWVHILTSDTGADVLHELTTDCHQSERITNWKYGANPA